MPRYDYECGACGKVFELAHGMSDNTPRFCPACGQPARRRFNAPGLITGAERRCGEGRNGACSYESTGQTCCGRGEPCGE